MLQVTETRSKGDVIGELAFFFRLRHLHTACVGRIRATVFMLPYHDYKQLAATYTEDDATVLSSLANSVDSLGSKEAQGRTEAHDPHQSLMANRQGLVIQKVEDAVQSREEQLVVKLLHAVAASNVQLVQQTLNNGTIAVRPCTVFTSKPGRCIMHGPAGTHDQYDRLGHKDDNIVRPDLHSKTFYIEFKFTTLAVLGCFHWWWSPKFIVRLMNEVAVVSPVLLPIRCP